MVSYESGVAQIVDEDLVDEAVLSEGLDHHHPLGAELQQDVGDVQRLKGCSTGESTPILVVVVGEESYSFFYCVRNSPRCAPGRRSGSRTG